MPAVRGRTASMVKATFFTPTPVRRTVVRPPSTDTLAFGRPVVTTPSVGLLGLVGPTVVVLRLGVMDALAVVGGLVVVAGPARQGGLRTVDDEGPT